MREIFSLYTTKDMVRLALAALLALPLNFAAAKPKPSAVEHFGTPPAASLAPDQRRGGRPLAAGAVLPFTADASGRAVVIDGDTLDVGGIRVRLEGIDAPERAQSCHQGNGSRWPCGRRATRELRRLVKGKVVRCLSRGRGSYGRMLGVCYVGRIEINAELVRRGLAWAFVKYSTTYTGVEAIAKRRRVGIWRGRTQPAWKYRANRWASAGDDAPGGCAIKGNISRRGHIYHMPWGQWYRRVKIEPAKGERWFCSEAQAVAAGWRAVAAH